MADIDDRKEEEKAQFLEEEVSMEGYNKRQCGCFWILYLFGGLPGVLFFLQSMARGYVNTDEYIIYALVWFCWALGSMYTQIQDKGDHLLITYGPCRWCLCGMGKEKIRYRYVRDFEVTQTCSYGIGINCNTVKLFNTCSCCCGDGASLCGHQVVRITIKERPQALGAKDDTDCIAEKCCFDAFCGENARFIGKGCCFQPCCNPCNANCCMMNTVFVSTNDAANLLRLLSERTGINIDNDGQRVVEI